MTAEELPMCPRCETIWRLTMNKQQHLILSSPTRLKTMPYLIETYDKPDHQSLRQRIRPVHLEYLEMNKNKLLASGAKLDDAGQNASGGIYILDTESRSDAEAFIAEDPFTKTELFQRIEITRWRKAYFNFESYLRPPDSPASTSRYLSPQRKNRR